MVSFLKDERLNVAKIKSLIGFGIAGAINAEQVVAPEVSSEKNKLPPSHYFRRNFYFTIETEEPELPDAIEFLGADRFLFATDYPHEDPGGRMKFNDSRLLAVNRRISETDKDLLRHGNAQQLFKL